MLTPSSTFVLTFLFGLIGAQANIYPTAGLNTKWILNSSDAIDAGLIDVIPVLLRGHHGCANPVVWSANRNRHAGNQSTLELTEGGDLVLKDADGSVMWSTQTSGKSVAGIKLTDAGNLVLFDENDTAVWESFDDPMDTLLPGQKLRVGQKLTPSYY
ncbi:hypothetical protein NL676_001741 [Syzygium grande]|nr:hypothetical protein NL676_001741 [Syzygium grande]